MPFGFVPYGASPVANDAKPTPAPNTPSQYFQDFEEAMAPSLDAQKKAAEIRYQGTVDALNQAITRTQGLANPVAPMAVPDVNPGMAALAGFFAHLNQAQGGGTGAVAGFQNAFGNLLTEREQAIANNERNAQNFSLSQFGTVEDLHKSLLEAQRDRAAEIGDLDKTYQYNKSLYALERQKKKEDADAAMKAAEAKATTTQANTQENIRLRAQLREKQARVQAGLRKEAESKAMTPPQRARMAQVNARVAELRAEMDDFRGAKDIAGEPVNTPEEIAAREAVVDQQIRTMYEEVKLEFEGVGTTTKTPPPPDSTPAGTVSDRVKSAAERLKGTALFN